MLLVEATALITIVWIAILRRYLSPLRSKRYHHRHMVGRAFEAPRFTHNHP